jgi:hypothetical protein
MKQRIAPDSDSQKGLVCGSDLTEKPAGKLTKKSTPAAGSTREVLVTIKWYVRLLPTDSNAGALSLIDTSA